MNVPLNVQTVMVYCNCFEREQDVRPLIVNMYTRKANVKPPMVDGYNRKGKRKN